MFSEFAEKMRGNVSRGTAAMILAVVVAGAGAAGTFGVLKLMRHHEVMSANHSGSNPRADGPGNGGGYADGPGLGGGYAEGPGLGGGYLLADGPGGSGY